MKCFLIFLSLSISANAANWYVRPGGSGNGTDWNNAWNSGNIGWASVSAGDTIWLAGGTYTSSIQPAKSGSPGNYIYIKRVTGSDTTPVNAAGYQSGFDAQVIIAPTGLAPISFQNGSSYLFFDGRVENIPANSCGMKLQFVDNSNTYIGSGVHVAPGAGAHDLIFSNLDISGPNGPAGGNNVGQDSTVNFASGSHFTVTHCRMHGCANPGGVSADVSFVTWDHCKIYDGNVSGGVHPNLIMYNSCDNGVIRYCEFWNWPNMGIDCQANGSQHVYIYGNIFRDTSLAVAHCIDQGTDKGSGFITAYIYNNVFVNVADVNASYARYNPGSQARNNIMYNAGGWAGAGGDSDYNFSNGPQTAGEAHSISSGPNPFIDYAGKDFRIVSTIGANYPRNKGQAVANANGQTYTTDAAGNTFGGADGAWDMGAFEQGGTTQNTNPVMTVVPSSIAFNLAATNTAVTNSLFITNTGGGTLTGTASVSSPFAIASGASYSIASNDFAEVKVKYAPTSPGINLANVSLTGPVTITVPVSGSAYVIQPSRIFQADKGTIVSPFFTNSGNVLQTNSGSLTSGGVAIYGFPITNAGTYFITNTIQAPGDGNNSVIWGIDAYPTNEAPAGQFSQIWDVPISAGAVNRAMGWRGFGTFDSNQFPAVPLGLAVGNHALVVIGREPSTTLGLFAVGQFSTNISAPVAAFTNSYATGSAPVTVYFTNLSTGAISFNWNFGDGFSSVATNASHTWSNAATYAVILTASGPGGTASATNYVAVTNLPNPIANFTAGPTSGIAPLTVCFTNLSTGAASNLWSFGDNQTSTALSPCITYNNAGTYTVSLTVSMSGSNNTLTLTNYITATNLPLPVANFTANQTSGPSPLTVTFTNLSTGANGSVWSLGDGSTNSFLFQTPPLPGNAPIHTYTTGVYTVTLSAIGVSGTNSISRTNYIVVTNGPPVVPVTNRPAFYLRIFTQ